MGELLNNPLYISIIIYFIIAIAIYIKKPSLMFDEEGNLRHTGFGTRNTVFSFPIILVLVSILIYFCITLWNKYTVSQ